MREILFKATMVLFVFLVSGCSVKTRDRDIIYQTSVLDALLNGAYDGDVTIGRLKKQGDFGIGTLNGLEGEMLAFDGDFFTVKEDGKAYQVGDSEKTPFAVVTFFDADNVIDLEEETDLKGLIRLLDENIQDKKIFHAIRIEGEFPYMKTKSLPRQTRPYPPFSEVAKNQPTFELEDTSGIIVGFFGPDYVSGINFTGYHFHYITNERDTGGHVLELKCSSAKITIDHSPALFYSLSPDSRPDKPLRLEVRIEP